MRKQLIFLHGFLGEPSDWRSVIEILPSDWHCLALDLNVLDPLLETKKYLETIKNTFFLVGYSMGGRIAWQLAKHAKAAVLIGAHPGLTGPEEKRQRALDDQRWIDLLEKGDMAVFLEQWYAQPLFSTLREKKKVIEKRMHRDPVLLAKILRKMCLSNQSYLSVTTPTLFLHGEEDLKYAALYSDQTHVEAIRNAGHAAHLDNPHAVADAIRRFVENTYENA